MLPGKYSERMCERVGQIVATYRHLEKWSRVMLDARSTGFMDSMCPIFKRPTSRLSEPTGSTISSMCREQMNLQLCLRYRYVNVDGGAQCLRLSGSVVSTPTDARLLVTMADFCERHVRADSRLERIIILINFFLALRCALNTTSLKYPDYDESRLKLCDISRLR